MNPPRAACHLAVRGPTGHGMTRIFTALASLGSASRSRRSASPPARRSPCSTRSARAMPAAGRRCATSPSARARAGGSTSTSRSTAAENAPVLVFFYGGSWQSGSKEDYAFVGQALAAQGFVTVLPDYRLYPEAPFPGFLEDGAAAIAWVRDNIAAYGGDPRRIVLAGPFGRRLQRPDARPRPALPQGGRRRPEGDHARSRACPAPTTSCPSTRTPPARCSARRPIRPRPSRWPSSGPRSPPAFLATGDDDTVVRPRQHA